MIAQMNEPAVPGEPAASTEPGAASPLRSVHSTSLAALMRQLDSALMVTTYQAGKLVIARPAADGVVNTHFRDFPAPMGLALDGGQLAIGTTIEIREFHDVPAVAAKLEPPGRTTPASSPGGARHRQHPGPRDGLGRRRRPLDGQHPVLVPLHPRRSAQLRPPLAAAVHHRR